MKFIPLVLLSVTLLHGAQDSKTEPQSNSIEWLKTGCAAAVLFTTKQRFSADQEKALQQTMFFYGGIIEGIAMSQMLGDEDVDGFPYPTASQRLFPSNAASILSFLQQHEMHLHKNLHASHVIVAWYLTHHPKSSELARAKADLILNGALIPKSKR